MIEEAIRTLLAAAPLAGGRVFPVVKPQDATVFPLYVYERITSERPHSHGPDRASGLGVMRIQIKTWSKTYATTRAASEEARKILDGFKGDVVVPQSATYEVQAILAEDERDDYDEETRLFGSIFDVRVWWTEASPS
jgi:hypothetical protein